MASNTEQFLTPVECTFWVNIPNWTIHHNLLIFLFVPYCSVFEVHNLGSSICLITSGWVLVIKLMIFIPAWHLGHSRGSTSHTFLMHSRHVFGGQAYVITSVPELLSGKPLKPLIVEIVGKIIETGASRGMERAMGTCFAVMACHGAIRANSTLTPTAPTAVPPGWNGQ